MVLRFLFAPFCLVLFCLAGQSAAYTPSDFLQTDCEEEITVDFTFDCFDGACEFEFTFQPNGGLPATDSTSLYSITGTGIFPPVSLAFGEVFTISYQDGTAVVVTVSDESDCETEFSSNGPVTCYLSTDCSCSAGEDCLTDSGQQGVLNSDCDCVPTCTSEITIDEFYSCDSDACVFTYVLQPNGGLPALDSTAVYSVVGTGIQIPVLLSHGEDMTLSFADGTAVDILVTDESGCETTWSSNGPVTCCLYSCEDIEGDECFLESGAQGVYDSDCNCIVPCTSDIIVQELFDCGLDSTCNEYYTLMLLLDGGLPSVDSTALYNLSGNLINGPFAPGIYEFDVSDYVNGGSTITINVDDGSGCSETFSADLNCYMDPGSQGAPGEDCIDYNGNAGTISENCDCVSNCLVPLELTSETTCEMDENGCVQRALSLSIEGGLPSIDSTAVYTLSVTVLGSGTIEADTLLNEGEVFTVIFDNYIYLLDIEINISDNDQCVSTIVIESQCSGFGEFCECGESGPGNACSTWNGLPGIIDDMCYCIAIDTVTNIIAPVNSTISLSPNPVIDLLSIQSTGSAITEVAFYDIEGRMLWREKIDGRTYKKSMAHVSAGMYFVVATLKEGGVVNQKFIKE